MTSLNPEQTAAVTAPDGPSLVLAGAGSGKTRVIIERMLWLIEERGVDPRRLLAMTFTNKAASEMRQRIAGRLGVDRVPCWMGTFHSFGLYVLRREIEQLGRSAQFTVFDDADQLSMMKTLVKALSGSFARVTPRGALDYISSLKQRVETPELEPPAASEEEAYVALWNLYHDALLRANAVDFDDLLTLPVRLFEEHESVRAKYERRFSHVHVDEYQDTNHAQYRVIRALCKDHKNAFAVGDEDQSIYAWRGADIRNILDFERDFPNARVFRLERNYRSTAPILEAANAVVANNRERLGKRLWTDQASGEKPRFYQAEDAEEEARWVVNDIVSSGAPLNEVAVLFRTNAQSRLFEEACSRRGLRCVVLGGIRFYSRKEIKDILAYLHLIVNPADDVSLTRVINVPPRGVGSATLEHIAEYAAARRAPLFQVARDIGGDTTFSARAREAIGQFVHLIDDLASAAAASPVAPLVERLLDAIGYREYVRHSDEKDSRARLEIVDEFVAGCRQFDAPGGKTLAEFLQERALLSDVDEWDKQLPAVALITCHNAKGLEFDRVYVAGLEDGLFPFVNEFDDHRDIEEERRLCYVAMTRARRCLTLTAAASRMLYGRTHDEREVSRFVREIGRDRLLTASDSVKKGAPPGDAEARTAQTGAIRTGVQVRHARFGAGTVLFTTGSGDRLRARIRFKTGRTATLMVSQAPIEILEGRKP